MRCRCPTALALLRVLWAAARKVVSTAVAQNPAFFWRWFTLFFITFIILLPWVCNDWAHSPYLSSSWKHEDLSRMVMESNKEEVAKAQEYIAKLDFATTHPQQKENIEKTDLELVIGVITVKRSFGTQDVGYLTRVMARLHAILSNDKSFPKKALFMCNTYPGPGRHREAEKLGEYFALSTRFTIEDSASVILDRFEKEKQDYSYCLKEAAKNNPKYILLVEDDALPRLEVLGSLKYILDHHIDKKWSGWDLVERQHNWAYLKLFYPEKWQGFASELRPLLELLAMCMITGSLSVVALQGCAGRGGNHGNKHVTGGAYCVAFSLGAVYILLVALLVGRQYLLELKRVSPALYDVLDAPNCCSPAILYPGHIIPNLTQYLDNIRSRSDFGIDIALDKYVTVNQLQKYLVEPNLFKHIGYISTIKGPSLNPAMYLY